MFATQQYEIDLGTRKTILHVNILRRFYEREKALYRMLVHDDTIVVTEETVDQQQDSEDDLPNPEGTGWSQGRI